MSNLRVGDNLQDHVVSLAGPFILNDSVSFIADRDLSVGAAGEYVVNQTGTYVPSMASELKGGRFKIIFLPFVLR